MASYATSKIMAQHAGWIQTSNAIYHVFLKTASVIADRREAHVNHLPAVSKFAAEIRADGEMIRLFDRALVQGIETHGIKTAGTFEEFLYALDAIVVSAPRFYTARDEHGKVTAVEPVGIPICNLFDPLCNTSAGYDLLRRPAFNKAMKPLLDSWGEYLGTRASSDVLTDGADGWFGEFALASLEKDRGKFNETYVTPDPTAVNRGYTSWDAFFTRRLLPHTRPILHPDDDSLIHQACESTVYNIAYNVKKHDKFWLKAQPYSLFDMFDGNSDDAERFVGGTVYQAYLTPQDYHRWHSPVQGVVSKIVYIPGCYFATLPDEGAEEHDTYFKAGDPRGSDTRCQSWLTTASTRTLVFIEADNSDIGCLCFMAIGMSEVSTCEVTVKVGERVGKGGEIGMFHFGGSSHAVVFGPRAKIRFGEGVEKGRHVWVNSVIARVG